MLRQLACFGTKCNSKRARPSGGFEHAGLPYVGGVAGRARHHLGPSVQTGGGPAQHVQALFRRPRRCHEQGLFLAGKLSAPAGPWLVVEHDIQGLLYEALLGAIDRRGSDADQLGDVPVLIALSVLERDLGAPHLTSQLAPALHKGWK